MPAVHFRNEPVYTV